MGPGVAVTVLPLKESFHSLVMEACSCLHPYLPEITAAWLERFTSDMPLDHRAVATLERITLSAGCDYFLRGDFLGYYENLNYHGTRLAKLEVDTRAVRRALQIFEECCDPYMERFFAERHSEMMALLQMVSSSTFATIAGAYFRFAHP
jgi:hypothetical protein